MARGRRSRSPGLSKSETSSEEDETYPRGHSSDSGTEDSKESLSSTEAETIDPLASHFADQRRVDEKKTTLTLLPSTLKYFFSTVLRKGELTKEGREELSERYHLETEQFEKIRAPRLDDTTLFRMGDEEFKNSRGGRLVTIHDRNRNAAKLTLALLERILMADHMLSNQERGEAPINQIFERIDEMKNLAMDLATLVGQTDVAITEARELDLEKLLDYDFRKSLHNLNKRAASGRETRFENNKLLHTNLDSIVKKRSRETKLNGVLNKFSRGNYGKHRPHGLSVNSDKRNRFRRYRHASACFNCQLPQV